MPWGEFSAYIVCPNTTVSECIVIFTTINLLF